MFTRNRESEKSLVQHQKALEIRSRVFGSEHPAVAEIKYTIASTHERQGDVEEAKKLFLECEQIFAKVCGQDHSKTVDAARRAQKLGRNSVCCMS